MSALDSAKVIRYGNTLPKWTADTSKISPQNPITHRANPILQLALLIAHMDVVEARRQDWAFDPFKLQEVDGFFRARGSIDDKAMASIFVANVIEYAKEGFKPDRDIILALTADEELSDSPHTARIICSITIETLSTPNSLSTKAGKVGCATENRFA
jgi:acetylornithine deacetylase/succinyl-diaminopimelate desuccinylase-like protein